MLIVQCSWGNLSGKFLNFLWANSLLLSIAIKKKEAIYVEIGNKVSIDLVVFMTML